MEGSASACDVNELEQLLEIIKQKPEPDCNNTLDQENIFNFSILEVCGILKERQTDDWHVSSAAAIVLTMAYSVLITLGLATNLAVSFVVARRTQMHTPRNLYIVNLTISDITLCVVCMPFTLTRLIKKRWTLGNFLCKLVPALQGANIMVSTGTIAAIALDRYFSIVKRSPQDGGGAAVSARRRSVVLSIAAIWVMSVIATLPLLFTQRVEYFRVENVVLYEICIESWLSREAKLAYTVATLIVMYVIPIAVVVAVHVNIATFLNEHATKVTAGAVGRAQREMDRNKRTTLVLSCVAVLFAVSWLPHYVLSVLVDAQPGLIGSGQLYVATAVCHIIAMSSAVSNPIVYGWLNTNIRREFISLLPESLVRTCCRNRRPSTRRAANGNGRSGVDREAFGMSAGAGFLGETTAVFEERISRAKLEPETTILLVPRTGGKGPRATSSTQLMSEL